ncbi:pancreatic triacylglycerol lipase [Hyalella azteca]|uniref:Pancreatic triacylglycerol lipase n=1 Tax=Hyalella azteca TaxID=294128 RepID=A0A8B7PIY8_HYAAZ|nr:pancreatic triacylglycerol lipase [Hyalella azteca]
MTTASNALGQNLPRKLICILFTALIMTIAAADEDHTSKTFQMRSDNSSIGGMHNQKTGTITCQPEVPSTASVCYDIYGELEEFSLESPWSSVTPAMRNTKFWLTSSPDQERPLVLNPNNTAELTNAPLNVEGKVYALVHDWNTGGKWTKLLRRELMRAVSSNNVVVVRWSNDTYSQSVANIRVVARQLAFFINRLQVLRGIPSHSFHLVGHGLGAHLCGIAGTYLQQRYGITVQSSGLLALSRSQTLHAIGGAGLSLGGRSLPLL